MITLKITPSKGVFWTFLPILDRKIVGIYLYLEGGATGGVGGDYSQILNF